MRKSVAIFGAGVGGLTAAHQLFKFCNVDIYEKKDTIGGLARSSRDKDGCATEYCWRVYFGFYKNLFGIMSEIPIENNKTVLDNLTVYKHVNFIDTELSFTDKLKVIYSILYGVTSCDDRLYDLDSMTWWESMNGSSDSNLFRSIGGWLGMDRYKGSYNSVIRVGMEMQIIESYLDNSYNDFVTTKPTSEAWFDPWYIYLKSSVNFHLEHELVEIVIDDNKIQYVIVKDQNGTKIVYADYYIFSIPVEAFASLIKRTPKLQFNNILELEKTCLHMQLSFQIYFNKKIELGANAYLIVDSPWDIIVLCYDEIFCTDICTKIPNVKSAWSVAACTAYTKGIIFNKPMNLCSYDEIVIELWEQITRSRTLQDVIHKNNGFYLEKELVIKWAELWPSYRYSDGKLLTSEPKFTNNINSKKLRPSFKTDIDNLYIATGYIQETIDIFSMEAACIAGKAVAYHILNIATIKPIYIERPCIFKIFRDIDYICYSLNLPNINPALIVFLLVFLIVIITNKIRKSF